MYVPAISENDVKIFEVQTAIKDGDEVVVTGQVESNIVECVQVALSLFDFNIIDIEKELIEHKKIHIHFSDGSFYKEGTSVGLGIICSILSALNIIKTKKRALVSGEIDLWGNICPVGGIDKKFVNQDYDYYVIPKDNMSNEINADKFKGKIIAVDTINELIERLRIEYINEGINI